MSGNSNITSLGLFDNPQFLEDLRKLLDIIAEHSERMRGEGRGGSGQAGDRTASNDSNTGSPPVGTGRASLPPGHSQGGGKGEKGVKDAANGRNKQGYVGHGTSDRHVESDPNSTAPDEPDELSLQPYPPAFDGNRPIHIVCKGISVCNPVTVIHTRDGKAVNLDGLAELDRATWWKRRRGRRRKKKTKQKELMEEDGQEEEVGDERGENMGHEKGRVEKNKGTQGGKRRGRQRGSRWRSGWRSWKSWFSSSSKEGRGGGLSTM
jgi:hypothetical protein